MNTKKELFDELDGQQIREVHDYQRSQRFSFRNYLWCNAGRI